MSSLIEQLVGEPKPFALVEQEAPSVTTTGAPAGAHHSASSAHAATDTYIVDGLREHIKAMVERFHPYAYLKVLRHDTGHFVISNQPEEHLKEFEKCTYKPSPHIKMFVTGEDEELHRLERLGRTVIQDSQKDYPNIRVKLAFAMRYRCPIKDEELDVILMTIKLESR